MSNTTFEIPQFQREYSWGADEVSEFWADLRNNIDSESYFLGLVILTDQKAESEKRKYVVDGQQRIITLTLLVNAIYHEAIKRARAALADRIQADFLRSIDYDTDETAPRVKLSDTDDNRTFQDILAIGVPPLKVADDTVSQRMAASFQYLKDSLAEDLGMDPFKRLGKWTDFLTNRLYFAVFVHPDASSAYQVYEVINTRGKELTTADLLKNFVLSQTNQNERSLLYAKWQEISKQFSPEGANNFVQYIRHVVTVRSGHVPPKDLFGFLAGRVRLSNKSPPAPSELMTLLQDSLPLYLQMVDQSLAGPAEPEALRIFSALSSLSVIAVRPILLAIARDSDALEGMKHTLKLVVRRIVVGNLGTGNIERRFGEAAKKINDSGRWDSIVSDLKDLNPSREEFVKQIKERSFNKQVLTFIRRSVIQRTITPIDSGTLHFIWTKQAPFAGVKEEEASFRSSTICNTFLSTLDRRPKGILDWDDFKASFLPSVVPGEWYHRLDSVAEWNAAAMEPLSNDLAEIAGDVWYG